MALFMALRINAHQIVRVCHGDLVAQSMGMEDFLYLVDAARVDGVALDSI